MCCGNAPTHPRIHARSKGARGPGNFTTLPTLLREHGYRTAGGGKVRHALRYRRLTLFLCFIYIYLSFQILAIVQVMLTPRTEHVCSIKYFRL